MSRAILDTSVAIALVADESRSRASADAVAGHDLVVPDVFWGESSNALVRKVRLGMLTSDDALDAYALLRRLVARTLATEPLGRTAIPLALDLGHPVYDCFFLAAAIIHDAPLLTADREFHARAVAAGYGQHVVLVP